jgi:hypothetical protein
METSSVGCRRDDHGTVDRGGRQRPIGAELPDSIERLPGGMGPVYRLTRWRAKEPRQRRWCQERSPPSNTRVSAMGVLAIKLAIDSSQSEPTAADLGRSVLVLSQLMPITAEGRDSKGRS